MRLPILHTVVAFFVFSVQAATLTVPDGTIGYFSSPFRDPFSPNGTTRHQEVFDQDAFGFGSPNGVFITGLAFYTQSPITNGRFTLTFNLSTTPMPVDGLSSTFVANIGADDTQVFSSVSSVFLSTVTDGQGRNVVEFPLQQQFLYRPQLGNLLFDLRNFDAVTTPGNYAWVNASNDPVSSLFQADMTVPFGVPSTAGLQVRFTYEPVPEPSMVALFILGAAGLVVLKLMRRRGSKP